MFQEANENSDTPSPKESVRLSPDGLWLVGIAAIALVARLIPGLRVVDDAYITFRYARNLAGGVGFVYNAGERVLGTTTPLYTLCMAALSIFGGPDGYPTMAVLLNALADALGALLLYRLALALGGSVWAGRAAALLWALSPVSVTFAVGGMETSVYITLLMGAFLAHLVGRSRLSAALAALVVLTRPDGLLAVVLIFAHLTWERKRIPWAEGLTFVLLLAPWLIFSTLYFGSPLSNSVSAKVVAYKLGRLDALVRLLQHFSTPFFENLPLEPFPFGRYWPLVGLILYGGLYAIGGLYAARNARARSLPLVIYPIFYAAVFAWANPLIFRWYLAPPTPFFFLGVILGACELTRALCGQRERLAGVVGAILLLAAAALSLNAWELHPDHGPDRPAPRMAFVKLEEMYRRVALELRPNLTPQTAIAAGDIGALGYYSGARILDTVGLVSPKAVAYYPLASNLLDINYAMSDALIMDERPDYVVTMEVYARHTLLTSPSFLEEYREVERLPTDIYGSRGMLVFRRLE